MTDPQGQANRWIKKMEEAAGLRVVSPGEQHIMRTVEGCMRMGVPLLLENVGQTLEPALHPLLLRQISRLQGRLVVRLGDVDVDYNPQFRFYITCALPQPRFDVALHTMLALINFTVTRVDLEEQLLTMVVMHEQPELELEKDRLVVHTNAGEKHLGHIEDEILDMLKSARRAPAPVPPLSHPPLLLRFRSTRTCSRVPPECSAVRSHTAGRSPRLVPPAHVLTPRLCNAASLGVCVCAFRVTAAVTSWTTRC